MRTQVCCAKSAERAWIRVSKEPNKQTDDQEPIGEVRIKLDRTLGMTISTTGALKSPHMLEAAAGYLRAFADRQWPTVFERQDK